MKAVSLQSASCIRLALLRRMLGGWDARPRKRRQRALAAVTLTSFAPNIHASLALACMYPTPCLDAHDMSLPQASARIRCFRKSHLSHMARRGMQVCRARRMVLPAALSSLDYQTTFLEQPSQRNTPGSLPSRSVIEHLR